MRQEPSALLSNDPERVARPAGIWGHCAAPAGPLALWNRVRGLHPRLFTFFPSGKEDLDSAPSGLSSSLVTCAACFGGCDSPRTACCVLDNPPPLIDARNFPPHFPRRALPKTAAPSHSFSCADNAAGRAKSPAAAAPVNFIESAWKISGEIRLRFGGGHGLHPPDPVPPASAKCMVCSVAVHSPLLNPKNAASQKQGIRRVSLVLVLACRAVGSAKAGPRPRSFPILLQRDRGRR